MARLKTVQRLARSTRSVGKAARELRGLLPKREAEAAESMSPRAPEAITASDGFAEQRRRTLVEADGQEGDRETVPDVLLDVPMLKVDKLGIDVDQLNARVSMRAQLGDLVNIEVGADVGIDRVSMTIEGVEAQAILKARLERVYQIFNRALETVDKHPEVLAKVLQPLAEAGLFEAAVGSEATTTSSDGEPLVTDAGPVEEPEQVGE